HLLHHTLKPDTTYSYTSTQSWAELHVFKIRGSPMTFGNMYEAWGLKVEISVLCFYKRNLFAFTKNEKMYELSTVFL
ncbi:MAG TPA: hypothetical protein VL576_02565, partial [Candidatus Paceibacterota bacterium]|nr:hypothetical protein [Candidatus Paceibacterota bacterium]